MGKEPGQGHDERYCVAKTGDICTARDLTQEQWNGGNAPRVFPTMVPHDHVPHDHPVFEKWVKEILQVENRWNFSPLDLLNYLKGLPKR